VKGARDYKAYRAAWENFIVVKEHGRPVAKNVTQAERLAYTNDPRVGLAALRPPAFRDARTWLRSLAKRRKDSVDNVCVRRMHQLLERNKTLSVPGAATRVAVEFWISGPTFDAVVKRLKRAYQRARPILVSRVLSDGISEVWTNGRQTAKVAPVMQKVRRYRRS
jgi:hypothetical protein